MSYGQIAWEAGSPRAARQVVRILHSMSRSQQLPWHRVVNQKGEIAITEEGAAVLQRELLVKEGVEFDCDNRILLEKYRWQHREIDSDL